MELIDAYLILRPAMIEAFESIHFEPVTRTKEAWYKPGRRRFLILKLRFDDTPTSDDRLAGRCYLQGWSARLLANSPDHLDEPLSASHLLSEDLLARMKDLNDLVQRKALARNPGRLQCSSDRDDAMTWLDPEDVAHWASFLAEAIPHAAGTLAKYEELGMLT